MSRTNLKKQVMRRVYIIYARGFIYENGHYALAFVVFCVLLSSVSLGNILYNMPKENFRDTSVFVVSAVTNTEAFIKFLFGALLLSLSTPAIKFGLKYSKKINLRPSMAFLQGQ